MNKNRNNLIVDLQPREDAHQNIFFLGRLKFPGTIDLINGISLLVFLSESGDEQLQIAVNDKEDAIFNKLKKKKEKSNTRLEIVLDHRIDGFGKKYFLAKTQMNGHIICNNEVVFLVFISRPGEEEIQIVGNIEEKEVIQPQVEILRRR